MLLVRMAYHASTCRENMLLCKLRVKVKASIQDHASQNEDPKLFMQVRTDPNKHWQNPLTGSPATWHELLINSEAITDTCLTSTTALTSLKALLSA